MTRQDILRQLEDKMIEVLTELEHKLRRELPLPTLELRKLGKCAGRSNFVQNRIQINEDFCHNGHWRDTLNVTLPHELAHIVADSIYSRDYLKKGIDMRYTPHGNLWKKVMGLMGVPASVYHNMSMAGVTVHHREVQRPYVYKCGCCEHHVSLIKHNRVIRGRYLYFRCKFCKEELKFVRCEQLVSK